MLSRLAVVIKDRDVGCHIRTLDDPVKIILAESREAQSGSRK